MNKLISHIALVSILLCGLSLAACGHGESDTTAHSHDEHGEHSEETAAQTGPNGGRLLVDQDFELELAIFERGIPPEYRAWARRAGKPLAPADVKLEVTIQRLDGETQVYAFSPHEAFLQGKGVVEEPHSFAVSVRATHAGSVHQWQYDSFEGRVEISRASADAAGVKTETAGPQTISDVLPLYGRVVLQPDAVREVHARFPGVIRNVGRALGDRVRAGEVLARVESDDSLQVYTVTAPLGGIVSARTANVGEHTSDAALFTVSDPSRLWIELSVFPRDLARLQVGQPLQVSALDGARSANARITRIAPAGHDATQAFKVWANFDAPPEGWSAGLYANAQVAVGGAEVPLAVRASALQTFRDFTVVFARVDNTYEVRMLELGQRDDAYVEVLGGLKPGTAYVTANSYLIKADIEKSGAAHDH